MMNIPNYITLGRVILIPFFINLLIYGYYREALLVFVIAGVTDALDGLIARLTNSKTQLGAFLDPLADKLLILSAFVALVLLDKLPVWLAVVVVSRDVILALGSVVVYMTKHELTIIPSAIGKTTTVLQLLVVGLTLLVMSTDLHPGFLPFLQGATAVVTVGSGIQYVLRGMKMVGQHAP